MAFSQNSINLIRTKTSGSPQLDSIEFSLRRSGYIGLFSFLCVGFVLGALYFFFSQENAMLVETKQTEMAKVSSQKSKEGIYISIQDRTKVISSVLASQRPWTKVLDRVSSFVSPPELTSVSVDDQNKMVLSISSSSLESVLTIVNAVIAEAQAKHFINPQLLSLQIGTNGTVQLSIAFLALFENL